MASSRGLAHCLWRRVGGEELGGDRIHADVGALRGEDGGYEELLGRGVGQRALHSCVGPGCRGGILQDLGGAGRFDFEFGYAVCGRRGGDEFRGRSAVGGRGLEVGAFFGEISLRWLLGLRPFSREIFWRLVWWAA